MNFEFLNKIISKKLVFTFGYFIVLFSTVLFLLGILDVVLFFFNNELKESNSILFQKNYHKAYIKNYYVPDPLLGWKHNEKVLNQSGFNLEHDMIVLSTKNSKCENIIKIIVTGGSTSDLIEDNNSWPIFLIQYLDDIGICSKVYVAAVGGYHSGQEYLKVLSLYNLLKPDYHISYSGVNDFLFKSSFVTDYEIYLFRRVLGFNWIKIFPNIINTFTQRETNSFKNSHPEYETHEFLIDNYELMNLLAQARSSKFLAFLQPINDYELTPKLDDLFSTYYELTESISSFQNIYDLTEIFKDLDVIPFYDFCHIQSHYQHIVAGHIFNILLCELQ